MSNYNSAPTLLQICPSDGAPFGDLCDLYAAAAHELGATTHTVYLKPPSAQPRNTPFHQPHYLRGSVHHFACAQEMVPALPTHTPTLALCHRYRSHRVLRRSRIQPEQKILLAHEYGMLKRWQRRLSRRLFARDFQFAGVSEDVANELAAVTGSRLILPNGIDQAALDQSLVSRTEANQRLGLGDSDSITLGVVGRLHPKKQPLRAVEALREVLQQHPKLRLVFVGDGPLRPELEAAAGDLPVSFCGFVGDARRYFRAFDALLMTSAPVEAFGLVALEGLASGVPVLTPEVPGPASVLGSLGFYYPASAPSATIAGSMDQMIQLIENPIALAQWQAAAQTRVTEEFSIHAVAERLRPFLNA